MYGGGGGYGGLYHGAVDPADQLVVAAFDHDGGGFFLQDAVSVSPCAAGGGTTPYASIADYLHGFLDPAGLAAHFGNDDAPPPPPSCGLGGADAVVALKQEMVAQQSGSRRDDDDVDGQLIAAGPVTPANSSVLSSSSCEDGAAGAGADDEEEPPRRRCGKKGRIDGEEEQEEEGEADDDAADRNCKSSSSKENNKKQTARGEKKKKKAREPRVAFMTKSEVDHLEDGYRRRKYGQKAVKNSTYPRSYYRCTAARCGVKKRVERSQQDPSTVVTTYEGQHTHPSPVGLLRSGFRRLDQQLDGYAGGGAHTPSSFLPLLPPGPAEGIIGGGGGGGGLLPPSMRLLLQNQEQQQQQQRRARSAQLAAVEAYGGGVLDFIPSVP